MVDNCYNPIEQKMHNELGYKCDGELHHNAPEVPRIPYRSELWKKELNDENVSFATVHVNEHENTVEVAYELFAAIMAQLGFERA